MKILTGFILLYSTSIALNAQKFKSTTSEVSFYSEAAVEDIAASNKEGTSIFDLASGEVAFLIPIAGFEFEKSLMQEHFNEKYLESDKYPKASFQGIISGYSKTSKSAQEVMASGKLTIHGVTRDIKAKGRIEITEMGISLHSKFDVVLEDYKIKIPKLLWSNIAEQVEVILDFEYSKM